MRILLVIFACLLVASAPVAAQTVDDVNGQIESVLGDHAKYEEAFAALQVAVGDSDADAVAALVAYPLIANVGERQEIATAEDFAAVYDEIMTEEITTTIAEQTYETLFVNGEGIMFGNGEVWMSGVCTDDACDDFEVKIITIQSTEG